MHASRHARTGAALLEVIVGMAMLTIVASSWIALLRQTSHGVRELREREEVTRAASAELRRVVLWSRAQLEARVGVSRLSVFTLTVDRQAPSLFAIALRDTSSGAVVLVTSLYSPADADLAR